jgi:hypothetical protein
MAAMLTEEQEREVERRVEALTRAYHGKGLVEACVRIIARLEMRIEELEAAEVVGSLGTGL